MCGWAQMKASVRLILAVCCVYTVLSGFPRGEGLSDELSLCAVALNHSINTSNTSDYFSLSQQQLSKSVCRGGDYYTGCMGYQGTVSIESDTLSHTGASSVIRVAINPNATAGQEEFYYTFCVSYNESFTYELVACASNEGEELQIRHTWENNGLAQVRVGVFPRYYHGEPLGCNVTSTIVAGNFGLKLGMKLHNDEQTFSKTPPPFSSSSFPSSISSPVTNSTNNTYVTGNLTFEPITELTMGSSSSSDWTTYRYFFIYDYGDNSSLEEISYFNSSHLYERPGNYSYAVEGFAVYNNDNNKAYYGLHTGMVTILDPVSNLSVRFNNNNSIIADAKVYLHICANGSFPISVCWTVQPVNSSSNSSTPITTSQCPSPSNNIATCHSISQEYPCPSYETSFSEKGRYDMIVTFSNKVSCARVVYTFHVVAATKPPIVATTTSVGVVVAIVLAVVVVLAILAVGGYLPYRRYRNHMIETADFKFIDLSEKASAWSRFKQNIRRVVRSRRNTDKIGLVNLIDKPHGASGSSNSSTSSSSSSLGSYNNYNTV